MIICPEGPSGLLSNMARSIMVSKAFKRAKIGSIDFMRRCLQEGIDQGQLSALIRSDIPAFMTVTLGIELRRFIPIVLGIDLHQLVKDSPDVERGMGGSDDC